MAASAIRSTRARARNDHDVTGAMSIALVRGVNGWSDMVRPFSQRFAPTEKPAAVFTGMVDRPTDKTIPLLLIPCVNGVRLPELGPLIGSP